MITIIAEKNGVPALKEQPIRTDAVLETGAGTDRRPLLSRISAAASG